MKPHPACGEKWTTTISSAYTDPSRDPKPTAYTGFKGGDAEFDNNMKVKGKSRKSEVDYHGGYVNCYQLFDGTGWGTEKNTHTDQVRTSYRMNFNQPKPFHKGTYVNTHGRLTPQYKVFDVKDHEPLKNWTKASMNSINPAASRRVAWPDAQITMG